VLTRCHDIKRHIESHLVQNVKEHMYTGDLLSFLFPLWKPSGLNNVLTSVWSDSLIISAWTHHIS
jgi:hypothetical protein